MGEVWKARDTRLDRTVAIKVLAQHLSASPEVRQRFEREAKTISQLSHPHICALYDVGREGETEYLVMELLEGETLSDRLARGPLPLEQTLRYGVEISDALDKAHRQGIVHRDLKPGNVMLTKSGVKLLDFGLAKMAAPPAPLAEASSLPTQGVPGQPLTEKGTVMGTFQYMAPEQIEGAEADARTDIFALGTVLYEMATGRKAFTGKSRVSLIGSILKDEPPPISSIEPMTPPALDRLVQTCLAKEPDDRFQTAHDVKLQLRWIAEGGSQAGAAAVVPSRRSSRERLAWGLLAVALLAALAAVAGALFFARRARLASRSVRASILPPDGWSFAYSGAVAISPDARELAFVALSAERKALLWVRRIDALAARPLSDTEGASYPFWSPDSRFIGFFASGKLKKVDVSGGPSQTICDAPIGRGGSWNQDGVIVFAPRNRSTIHQVPASGGSPTPVTRFEGGEGTHRWPHFLPDGRHFLFTVLGGSGPLGRLFVGSLDSKERKHLLDVSSNVAYAPPGYLLFVRESNLLAQPFNVARREVHGESFLVGDRVSYAGSVVYADISASQQGVIVYKNSTLSPSRLVWHDREGQEAGSVGEPAHYRFPRPSPDGRKLAVILLDPRTQNGDIWLYGTERETPTRFTFQPGTYRGEAWSSDGRRIAYGLRNTLNVKSSSNVGGEEKVLESPSLKSVSDWSPDGRSLLYDEISGESGSDLMLLPLSGDRKPIPVLATPFNERGGRFSFDGRWIAYVSDESGQLEVYVRPFPGPGGAVRLSSGGGVSPRWRRDGREVFYIAEDRKLMAVEVKGGSQFEVGKVRPLFEARVTGEQVPFEADYEVAPDGQRFLINSPAAEKNVSAITLLFNSMAGSER
jgi:Tol biopolymer transport system component